MNMDLSAMSILLADDEPLARQRLKRMLAELGQLGRVIECDNGFDVVKLAQANQTDIIFLDMRMPGMTPPTSVNEEPSSPAANPLDPSAWGGLEIIETLYKLTEPPAIIVTTAWLEPVLQAYSPATVAYLPKPIDAQELQIAVAKAQVYLRQYRHEQIDEEFSSSAQKIFLVRKGQKSYRVRGQDIIFLKAEDKLVGIYTADNNKYWFSGLSLSQLLSQLSPLFIRIHRNCLVNRLAVVGLHSTASSDRENPTLKIQVRHYDQLLEVSRSQKHKIRTFFKTDQMDTNLNTS